MSPVPKFSIKSGLKGEDPGDRAEGGPDDNADDLGGDQGGRVGRQGEHQVALYAEKILIKAGDGQNAGHDDDGHHQDSVEHEDQYAGQSACKILGHEAQAQSRKERKSEHRPVKRQHNAPESFGFISY